MLTKAEIRQKVVDEVRGLLIGPRHGEEEIVNMRLTLRYFAGILFPFGSKRKQLQAESQEDNEDAAVNGAGEFSGDSDNPLSLANEALPSSVGLSFCINDNDDFECHVSAGRYKLIKKKPQQWQRYQIGPEVHKINASSEAKLEIPALDGTAEIIIFKRKSSFRKNQSLITVSLRNICSVAGEGKDASQHNVNNVENRLYQIELKVRSVGKILPYISMPSELADMESKVLDLQYSFIPTFAAAHGSSVNWLVNKQNKELADEVWVDYMPDSSVKSPEFTIENKLSNGSSFYDEDVLKLAWLASDKNKPDEVCERLNKFISHYKDWIKIQEELSVTSHHAQAKKYLIDEMSRASSRMIAGVQLLKDNPEYFEAFKLANYAMLLQMEQKELLAVTQSERLKNGMAWPIPAIESVAGSDLSIKKMMNAEWRPFQLAFFLLTVYDLENPTCETHGTNDLIWFSTGGGKTEAYLLLSAYELIRRRKRYSNSELGGGTAVLTRYTLRFLTADQFARTSALICALEKIRRSRNDLGGEPFSLGLFVGDAVSYNRLEDAKSDLLQLREDVHAKHRFQLEFCPNCGTEILPAEPLYNDYDEIDTSSFGVYEKGGEILTKCPNQNCSFHEHGLPIETIDEQIISRPPSILLGTVDKFARLAFIEDSTFFGMLHSKKHFPPSLIIQDELHLISGPLGSIAAIYESAFETLIKIRQEELGHAPTGPKYISSSATVREAHVQVERLMGKANAIFPPQGIKPSDSFFARENPSNDTARLYIGLMSQGLNATSSAHWVSAALLQSVRFLARENSDLKLSPEDLDFLWSLVIYCNSKRELGVINASVEDEIFQRMRVYADIQGLDENAVKRPSKEEISSDKVESISAARSVLQEQVLNDIEKSKVRDVVPATNMMSVGIDISRLGLMMINGQPKTTSEYIQASSRVGRSQKVHGPGLVFTLYSHAKPRDRSHYEYFKSYHESLYRLVEPTSITPGSRQALKKAAHAGLLIAIRHGVKGMKGRASAKKFDLKKRDVRNVIERYKSRLLLSYGNGIHNEYEKNQIKQILNDFIDEWKLKAETETLQYTGKDRNRSVLIRRPGTSKDLVDARLTMESMRAVDISLDILFKPKEKEEKS